MPRASVQAALYLARVISLGVLVSTASMAEPHESKLAPNLRTEKTVPDSVNAVLLLRPGGETALEHVRARLLGAGARDVHVFPSLGVMSARIPGFALAHAAEPREVAWLFAGSAEIEAGLAALERALNSGEATFTAPAAFAEAGGAAFGELIDRIIDEHQLVVVMSGPGTSYNALSLVGTSNETRKADLAADETAAVAAVRNLQAAGMRDTRVIKAVLINAAHSLGGRSSEFGWGRLTGPPSAPQCRKQSDGAADAPSQCFVSDAQTVRYYATTTGDPVKATLVWNRQGATSLPDLNLYLYDRETGKQIAASTSETGNVEQVSGSAPSGVLVKVAVNGDTGDGAAFALVSNAALAALNPPTLGILCVYLAQSVQCDVTNTSVPPTIPIRQIAVTGYWYDLVRKYSHPVGTLDPGGTAVTVSPFTTPFCNYSFWAEGLADDGQKVRTRMFTSVSAPGRTDCRAWRESTPPTCTYTLSDANPEFSAAGGVGSVFINTQPGCISRVNWDFMAPAWVGVPAPNGTGARYVNFSVAPNAVPDALVTSARTATVKVIGDSVLFMRDFTIRQAGRTCTYTATPGSATAPLTGIPATAPATIQVTAPAGCVWTARTEFSWIRIVSGAQGQGSGVVKYTIDAAAATRTGRINIGTATTTILQTAPAFSLTGTVVFAGTAPVPVTIRFTNYAGAAPPAVSTNTSGAWTQTGFSGSGIYSVEPEHPDYVFQPPSVIVRGAQGPITFDAYRKYPDTRPCTIKLTAPNGGGIIRLSEMLNVRWQHTCDPWLTVAVTAPATLPNMGYFPIGLNDQGGFSAPLTESWPGDHVVTVCVEHPEQQSVCDSSDATFKVVDTSDPSLLLDYPNLGENLTYGSDWRVQWRSVGEHTGVFVDLLRDGQFQQRFQSGVADGSFSAGDGTGGFMGSKIYNSPGTGYQIRISSASNPDISDVSDIPFVIRSSAAGLAVTVPNGGDVRRRGEAWPVRWTYWGNAGTQVRVEVIKAGAVVKAFPGAYPIGLNGYGGLTVPMDVPAGSGYRIRLTSVQVPTLNDQSDRDFAVVDPAVTLAITQPSGITIPQGSPIEVKWQYTGDPGPSVKVDLLIWGILSKTLGTFPLGSSGSGGTGLLAVQLTPGSGYSVRISSTSMPEISATSTFIVSLW